MDIDIYKIYSDVLSKFLIPQTILYGTYKEIITMVYSSSAYKNKYSFLFEVNLIECIENLETVINNYLRYNYIEFNYKSQFSQPILNINLEDDNLIDELQKINLEDINEYNKPMLQKRFELLNLFYKQPNGQPVEKEQLSLIKLIEIYNRYKASHNDLNYLLFDERMSLLLSKLVEKELASPPVAPNPVFMYKYNKYKQKYYNLKNKLNY